MEIGGINGKYLVDELPLDTAADSTKADPKLVNAEPDEGLDTVTFNNTKKTDADVEKKVNELKKTYSTANMQEFLDNKVILQLSREGFSKEQAISIVSQVMSGVITPLGENKYFFWTTTPGAAQISSQLFGAYSITSKEAEALENELVSMESDILKNNNDIDKLQAQIEELQKEIQKMFDESVDENEQIAAEHKANVKKATNAAITEYSNSKGEMTYEQFQNNLQGKLEELGYDANSQISQITSQMVAAESKMVTLAALNTRMGNLINLNKSIGNQAQNKVDEFDNLQDEIAQQSATGMDSDATSASPSYEEKDPIGFSSNNTTFDFFIDKDNNNDLSNANEFLGAEAGFSEVLKLDTNNDGFVNLDELEAGNIKIVKTDANGNQSIEEVDDILAQEDGIDLKSYVAKNEIMENGNTLQGVFDMKFNGKTLDDAGYQTLDKMDWLNDNYDFSDNRVSVSSSNLLKEKFDRDVFENPVSKEAVDNLNIFLKKSSKFSQESSMINDAISENKVDLLERTPDLEKARAQNQGSEIESDFVAQKKAEEEKLQLQEQEENKENKLEEEIEEELEEKNK